MGDEDIGKREGIEGKGVWSSRVDIDTVKKSKGSAVLYKTSITIKRKVPIEKKHDAVDTIIFFFFHLQVKDVAISLFLIFIFFIGL